MTHNLRHYLLPLCLIPFASIANVGLAASDFPSIVRSAKQVLAYKTYSNELGAKITFGKLRDIPSSNRAEIDVIYKNTDGNISMYTERYVNGESQTIVEQIVDQKVQGTFVATFELPYRVLRIRPIEGGNPDFISRECFYDESVKNHSCYFKLRANGSVYIDIFTEVKN